MDTIKLFNKGNTKIIAHRGLSGIEKENTLPAFVAAGNRSYFGIETDVHVTSDGKYVIIHDDTTGRVAPRKNVTVEGSTLEELRYISLSDRDGSVGRIDLRIPTLEEYVTVCKRYEKTGVLELKNRMTTEHIAGIVKTLTNMEYLDGMIFISFSLDNLIELRSFLPKQKLQFLVGAYNKEIHSNLVKYSLDCDIHYPILTKDLVDLLHRDGIEVNCWTCDSRDDAERLIEMGVDYITSNILE